MHPYSGMSRRPETPGDRFLGTRGNHRVARPGPGRASGSAARPSPSRGPLDAPSARPVWTVPAIVCGGCPSGRIVLAVSNLPRPLPGHRWGPHADVLSPPAPQGPSGQIGRLAPRGDPTFRNNPLPPTPAAPGPLLPAEILGTPHPKPF